MRIIDYETGEIKQGSHNFKQFSRTILEYANYLESKFDGDIGILERKHQAASVVYIGKGANNIDDQTLDIQQAQVFVNKLDIMSKILQLTPEMGRHVRGCFPILAKLHILL